MFDYYEDKLASDSLIKVYELMTPRIRQYARAEIEHVSGFVHSESRILELGCGYGRAMLPLAPKAGEVSGLDTSFGSLLTAKDYLKTVGNTHLFLMKASEPAFADESFDVVFAIQNGLSAFHEDQGKIISEALRITKSGGCCLFSTYSEKIWEARLEWFYLQSEAGLLGKIDESRTGNGEIVTEDGFTATTLRENDFKELTAGLPYEVSIYEVDESSLFCRIKK